MRLLSSGEEDNQTSSDGEDVEEGRPRRAAVRPPGASSAPQKRSSLAHKGPLRGRRYPKPRAAAAAGQFKRQRSGSGAGAGDDAAAPTLRVSVYCLGDYVNIERLLDRLERGEVTRPEGPWHGARAESHLFYFF